MFKKMVSQLSLSPSAAQNLTFYARRLKQESITRTFSVIAAVLLVGLQFSVILAPPVVSNAASASDIIYGGITGKQDLLNHYDGSAELKALYAYFGITRQDVVNSVKVQLNSRDHSLNSLGRVRHAASDQAITVAGHVYYARYLYQFDTGSNVQSGSYYDVYQGHTASGAYFAIMFHCGNLVFHALPKPPVPKPVPRPVPKLVPAPKPTPTPTPTPAPTPVAPVVIQAKTISCTYLHGSVTSGDTPLTVAFTSLAAATNQTITQYIYNFGDNQTETLPTATVSHVYTNAGSYVATLQVVGSAGSTTAVTAPCSYTINTTTAPNLINHKTAFNITQNSDATKQPAAAGDTIRYTLTVTNTGGRSASDVISDDFTDVVEYADITDTSGGTVQTGPNPGTTEVIWPATTVGANQTVTKIVTVKVKSPVPATPVGLSDPFSYDLRMDNVFGDTVHIAITPPPAKLIETAAAQLPDTGAGTSATIVILFAAFVVYFYARNRQLMTELKLLRGDYQGGHTN